MDENNLGNQNPASSNQPEQSTPQAQDGAQDQNDISMLDKVMQNNPFVKFNKAKYQNVQTQSMVKSTREEANEQLAEINARNAEIARQQKLAEEAAKAKRTGIYIVLAVFFGIVLIAAVWLTINAIIASQRTAETSGPDIDEGETKYGKVEGYKCTTDKCEKVTDTVENTILVRDGKRFYLYNTEKKESSLTTIPEQEYHAITPFVWAGKSYAVLDPESSQSALFSLTDNRQVTEFAYDSFYMDIKAEEYKEMTWVEGKYIVARSSGQYRLIQLSTGAEVAHAAKRVFVHDDYFFGYESDGSIHIYSQGKQIYVAQVGTVIFTNGTQVVPITKDNDYEIYEHDGTETEDETIRDYIGDIDSEILVNTLSKNAKYYHIPANN